jgi:hypothetical protein
MKKLLMFLLALIVVAPAWAKDDSALSSTGVVIKLKGSGESVSTLVADLKKQKVFKTAICGIVEESEIYCGIADSGLMAFIGENAPAAVEWSISSTPPIHTLCVPGCRAMHCPPPGGPVTCCNTSTLQACP